MWSVLLGLACTAPDKGGVAARDTSDDSGAAAQDTGHTGAAQDSSILETGLGDTAAADSGHTGSVDTGPVDTGPADTGDALSPDAVPDFLLADLNPTSARYGEWVSPRDYLEEVSGWYFIHAS